MTASDIWLNAAFICQDFLQEANGGASFIRLIDTVTVNTPAEEIIEEDGYRKLRSENAVVATWDFVAIFSSEIVRDFEVELLLVGPTKGEQPIGKWTADLDPTQFRAVFTARVNVVLGTEGTSYLYTKVNGVLVSKTPFRVVFNVVEQNQLATPVSIEVSAVEHAEPEAPAQ